MQSFSTEPLPFRWNRIGASLPANQTTCAVILDLRAHLARSRLSGIQQRKPQKASKFHPSNKCDGYICIDAFGGALCWHPDHGYRTGRPSPLEDDEYPALRSNIWLGGIVPYSIAFSSRDPAVRLFLTPGTSLPGIGGNSGVASI